MSFPRPLILVIGIVVLFVGAGLGVASTAASDPAPRAGTRLFTDSFSNPNGLLTNEYAYWNPALADSVSSPNWEMTSGSFFARGHRVDGEAR